MFQFKRFVIHQEHTPMKVGTDGVLLGAWAELEEAASILDIGTGTGLIALMAAQRNAQARIDALEMNRRPAGKPPITFESVRGPNVSGYIPRPCKPSFLLSVMTVSFVILLFSYTPHRHRITAVV